MKYLLCVALLLGGCHTLTPEEENEVRVNAVIGDKVLGSWDTLSDQQKYGFVWRFTRTCHNIIWTIDGVATVDSGR